MISLRAALLLLSLTFLLAIGPVLIKAEAQGAPIPSGLPPVDASTPADSTKDTDGDGFTDLEEGLSKTNPADKNSNPPYVTKLFVKRLHANPFPFLFVARNRDTILLNTLGVSSGFTKFSKVGDHIPNTSFNLTALTIKSDKISGTLRDSTEVTLTDTETNQSFLLNKETEADHATTYVLLTYLWLGKDFSVREGIGFNLPPEFTVFYRVMNLRSDEVDLLRLDDHSKITIHLLPEAQILVR